MFSHTMHTISVSSQVANMVRNPLMSVIPVTPQRHVYINTVNHIRKVSSTVRAVFTVDGGWRQLNSWY